MSVFRYKAFSASGQVVAGEMEGASRDQVIARLREDGLIPVDAKPKSSHAPQTGRAAKPIIVLRRKPGPRQVAEATRTLANMIGAGLTLEKGLEILIDVTEHSEMARILREILDAVRGGASLADALEGHEIFEASYVGMIRAGEQGGALAEVLAQLADYLTRAEELKSSIRSALAYPAILLAASVVSLMLLMAFVIPQFRRLFRNAEDAIPAATKFVMDAALWLEGNWMWLPLGAFVSALIIARALKRHAIAYRADNLALSAPLASDLIRKSETARFARTLGMLLGNGVPMLGALKICENVVRNRVMKEGVTAAGAALRRGEHLHAPLASAPGYPVMAVQMIRVGEETGRLPQMLRDVAEIYEAEIRESVKRLLAIIEPALILLFGVLIGGVIISIIIGILSISRLAA